MLAEVFAQDGDVVGAADGEEALEKRLHWSYDAILCDVLTPEFNGPRFYRRIEQGEPERLSRVLVVTGDVPGPGAQEFLQPRLSRIQKPLTFEEIRTTVRRILQAHE